MLRHTFPAPSLHRSSARLVSSLGRSLAARRYVLLSGHAWGGRLLADLRANGGQRDVIHVYGDHCSRATHVLVSGESPKRAAVEEAGRRPALYALITHRFLEDAARSDTLASY